MRKRTPVKDADDRPILERIDAALPGDFFEGTPLVERVRMMTTLWQRQCKYIDELDEWIAKRPKKGYTEEWWDERPNFIR